MAQLITQKIGITASKLLRDSDTVYELLAPEIIESIEAVITELVGDGVLVEVVVE
jgi:hypothetical protein